MAKELDGCQEIFNRMCEATGARNATDFAEKVGKTKQAVYHALKKDKIPADWLVEVACKTGCSIDWLAFGEIATPPGQVLVGRSDVDDIAAFLERIQSENQ